MKSLFPEPRGAWALLACALLASGLAGPRAASARENDLARPVDVSADRSEFDERAGTQVLEGNVDIRQGTMRIRAQRIEIRLVEGRLASIEGSGAPVRFEQEDDAGEPMRGEARRIRYDAVAGNLVLEGGATLSRPRQELKSERITFDARTQKVSAEGDGGQGDGGRVNIRIEPPRRDGANAPAGNGGESGGTR